MPPRIGVSPAAGSLGETARSLCHAFQTGFAIRCRKREGGSGPETLPKLEAPAPCDDSPSPGATLTVPMTLVKVGFAPMMSVPSRGARETSRWKNFR